MRLYNGWPCHVDCRRWILCAVTAAATALAGATAAPALHDVPQNHWASGAIGRVVAGGIMSAPGGRFQPDRPVSRAELAYVVVRMIDAVEKSGPRPLHKSPAKHDVPASQLAALAKLPATHPASTAYRRLVQGGYLSPPGGKPTTIPGRKSLDLPATTAEVADMFAAVALRLEEKRVGILHPEALKNGVRPETRGQ